MCTRKGISRDSLLPSAADGHRLKVYWDNHFWQAHYIAHGGFISRRANECIEAIAGKESLDLLYQNCARPICLQTKGFKVKAFQKDFKMSLCNTAEGRIPFQHICKLFSSPPLGCWASQNVTTANMTCKLYFEALSLG